MYDLFSDLDQRVASIVNRGFAFNSRRSYSSGLNRYISFTHLYSLDPLDLSELNLLRFIAHLSAVGLSARTIRVYISGVRSWFVTQGLQIPPLFTPRVKLALKSIERDNPPPTQASPLTLSILRNFLSVLDPSYDGLMLLSAFTLAYYACLRSSEYCFDPQLGHGLTCADLVFLDTNPPSMSVRVKASKTLIHGFNVVLGCSAIPFCSVCSMKAYFRLFLPFPSRPLFLYSDGTPLTYHSCSNSLKSLLLKLGLNPTTYSLHSLRAGSATDAATKGASSHFIRALGRWRSAAYMAYLRPGPEDQAKVARFLSSHLSH